jgi:sirohydrochlorin cobaltochelatase
VTAAAAQTPIVLVASGTTTTASATYRRIDAACRRQFPAHPVHWAYSSRRIRRRLRQETGEVLPTVRAVLGQLQRSGCRRVVVQSLHLICGVEFHHLVWQAAGSDLAVHLGLPLLAAPDDFDALLDWIASVRPAEARDGLVLVGHGTDHPAWMAYAVLAQRIEERFGERVALGQVRGEPSAAVVADRLAAAGFRRVLLRPLMLVAGAHFMQDIAGRQATSWQTQLTERGLTVSTVAEGLGADPVPLGIFCRHIGAALAAPPLDLS